MYLFTVTKRKLIPLPGWMKELREVIADHEKIEPLFSFPLCEMLFAYYELRKKFCYQLTRAEYDHLRPQSASSSGEYGGRRYLPYIFTKRGIAMLCD